MCAILLIFVVYVALVSGDVTGDRQLLDRVEVLERKLSTLTDAYEMLLEDRHVKNDCIDVLKCDNLHDNHQRWVICSWRLSLDITLFQNVIFDSRTYDKFRHWPIFCVVETDRGGSWSFQELIHSKIALP